MNVVQRIEINGTLVNQYFFETFCSGDLKQEQDDILGTNLMKNEEHGPIECEGIDKRVCFQSK